MPAPCQLAAIMFIDIVGYTALLTWMILIQLLIISKKLMMIVILFCFSLSIRPPFLIHSEMIHDFKTYQTGLVYE
jgi:hypothetical protein